MVGDSTERRDVVVKIDGEEGTSAAATAASSSATVSSSNNANAGKIWRESSYEFWGGGNAKNNGANGEDEWSFDFNRNTERQPAEAADPPSKLIGQFLHKQKASGEISLDMDINMSELQSHQPSPGLTTVVSGASSPATASTYRVAFETDGVPDAVRRRQSRDSRSSAKHGGDSSTDENDHDGDEAEVVKCSSSKSVKSNKSLVRMKTKSRLLDPPTPANPAAADKTDTRSGKVQRSGKLKSGFFGKSPRTPAGGTLEEEDEDDPFLDEDLPEDFKKGKLSVWVILEWISLILIIAALICSLVIRALRKTKPWGMELWRWEMMVLVLICGRLVSSWIVSIAVFCIESNFLLRKRVLYFVYGLRKAVQNCLWLGLVLIAWRCLFDKKVKRETRGRALEYVTKVLVCLLVGVIIWLVKTLLVKVLASSFHMSTYFDRIQESLFTQYVIETLSGPPVVETRRIEEEEERIAKDVNTLQKAGATLPPGLKTAYPSPQTGKASVGSGKSPRKSPSKLGKSPVISRVSSKREGGEDGIRIDHLQRLNTKNVSAWRMKRLINIIRNGSIFSTLDEQLQGSTEVDDNATHIRSEYEAKLAAKRIFQNVAKPRSRYIYLEDIMRFMSEEEASRAMGLFEESSNGEKISKACLKNWVVNAFRERRALALTLNDTKTAVKRLDHIINILVAIIIIVIWLLILGITTSKFLVFVSSQLLLVAFIFGNSCKAVFEAIIFLFVIHPFDVGDRCEIDDVQMIVEEMNILTTVFLRYDNLKIIYPNSVLATKSISNFYRSPDMGEIIEFFIHITTPAEKIAAMKQRIVSYVDNKKDHWYPSPMIVFRDMVSLNSVKIAIWPTHKMNFQDMGERFVRRAHLLEELGKICRELDIQFRLYPLDINVRSFPAVTSDRVPPAWIQQHGS